jgi:hypothetical protein
LLFQDGQHTKNQYGDTPKISRNSRWNWWFKNRKAWKFQAFLNISFTVYKS